MRDVTPIALAIAALVAVSAPAEAQSLDKVKALYTNIVDHAGAPTGTPVEVRRNDSWGDSDAPAPAKAAPRAADVDERFRDERVGRRPSVREAKPEAVAVERAPARAAAPKHQRDAAAKKPAHVEDSTDDYLAVDAPAPRADVVPTRRADSMPTEPSAKCVNVSRVWEGAAAMAHNGEGGRAYDSYLTLLASCSKTDELKGTLFQARSNLSAESFAALLKEPVLESPRLALAKYYALAQESYALDKAGKKAEALAVVRSQAPIIRDQRDASMMRLAGWLELDAKNAKVALEWFNAAVKIDRTDQSSREGMVRALLALGDVDAAQRELGKMDSAETGDLSAALYTARAFRALKDDDFQEALTNATNAKRLGAQDADLDQVAAWAYLGLKQYDKAGVLFQRLVSQQPSDTKLADGLMAVWKATGEHAKIAEAASHPATALGAAALPVQAAALRDNGRYAEAEKLDGVHHEGHSATVGGYVQATEQSGVVGEAHLTSTVKPVLVADIPLGNGVSVQARAGTESLDNGVQSVTGKVAGGGLRLDMGDESATATVQASQLSNGVTRVSGGLKLREYTDSGFMEVEGTATPMRDSVRSYAGGYNASGVAVGQATKYEGRVGGSTWISGASKLNYSLAAGAVQSQNEAPNTFLGATLSMPTEYQKAGFSWFSAGPEISVKRFARDENRFDAGNWGGYYSPTFDITGGMRLQAQTLEGKPWMAKVDTMFGLTHRTMYDSAAAGGVADVNASVGFLTPVGIVKAGLQLNAAPGYTSSGLWFGLVIPFERRTGLYATDLSTGP